MTQIERAFVDLREGQVHLRRSVGAAPADVPPLWMIHASPASSVSLVGLMQELGRTRRVIAPDTLGNGDSAPAAPTVPDIAYYADSSLRVMDALGIERVDLYGSHTGAHIVSEMAIARPDRFRRMILDGVAMFTPEEKKENLATYAPAIEPDAFGTQFHWAWHFVREPGLVLPVLQARRRARAWPRHAVGGGAAPHHARGAEVGAHLSPRLSRGVRARRADTPAPGQAADAGDG